MLIITTNINNVVVVAATEGRLSQLEILEVAIETGVENVEPPNERLKAKLQGITKTNIHLVTPCTYKPPEKLQKDILHKKMKT